MHADARAPDRMRIAGPVGRIAAAEAAALEYRDAALGMELGPLWATWWLDGARRRVPAEWEGEQVDLLLVTNSEATLWLDGEPVQGLVSGGAYVRADAMLTARAAAGEALSARVEIACNGLFGWSELHPQPHEAAASAPPFRLERCELARFDREAWALVPRPRRAGGADGRAGRRRRVARRAAARAQPLLQRMGRRGPRDVAAGPRDPRPAARGAAQRDPDARDHRHRPRAHRHGVAVAAGGDLPQVRADLRDPAAADGALPRLPLRLLAGPAVRVDPRPRARAVGADPRARRRRAVAPGRRDVDRAGLQPARRRVARAPVPLRPALLRARVRPPRRACSGTPTCSATTASCRRSCAAPGSTASSRRSSPGTASTRPSTTPSAGSGSTARRCSRTSRRPTPTTPRRPCPSCAARRATSRTTRCRRAACSSSAGATAAAGRRRRCSRRSRASRTCRTSRARRSATPRRSSRAGRRGGVARGRRRALPRVPPRHLHDPGAHQAREPARGAGAARRRAARGRRRTRRGRARSSTARGRRSCSTTSTTSSRARRSARSTRARSATWPRSRRSAGAVRDRLRRRRGRQHRRRRRAARWCRRPAGLRFAEAPPCGVGRLVERRREPCASTQDGDGFVLDNGRLRAVLGRDGTLRSLVELASGREAHGRARQRARALRGPPDRLRGLGPRPVPPRDPQRLPAGHVRGGRARRPAARRGGLRAPDRARAAACARPCGSTPSPRGWSSTARSTGTRTGAR